MIYLQGTDHIIFVSSFLGANSSVFVRFNLGGLGSEITCLSASVLGCTDGCNGCSRGLELRRPTGTDCCKCDRCTNRGCGGLDIFRHLQYLLTQINMGVKDCLCNHVKYVIEKHKTHCLFYSYSWNLDFWMFGMVHSVQCNFLQYSMESC